MTKEAGLNREIAKAILDAVLAMSGPLDDLHSGIDRIEDCDLKADYLEKAGLVMRDLTFNFVLPIVRLYPDLDPDLSDRKSHP